MKQNEEQRDTQATATATATRHLINTYQQRWQRQRVCVCMNGCLQCVASRS